MKAIQPSTMVRDLLRTYPQTLPVFLRHGMCPDCKTDPPLVPLAHFASKHCGGDLERLIEELQTAVQVDPDPMESCPES